MPLLLRGQARRAVAEPNAGFICALLSFSERIRPSLRIGAITGEDRGNKVVIEAGAGESVAVVRLYRLVPYFSAPSALLVHPPENNAAAAAAPAALVAELDERSALVLHRTAARGTPPLCVVWVGRTANVAYATAAKHFAEKLERFEGAPPACTEARGVTGKWKPAPRSSHCPWL